MAKAPTQYPEHAKLKAIVAQSQSIGEFLDWLIEEQRIVLCSEHEHVSPLVDERDGGCYASAEPGDFQWPPGSGRTRVCGYQEGNYVPVRSNIDGKGLIQSLLAQYFEIDTKRIDDEKDAMLDELRAANKSHA